MLQREDSAKWIVIITAILVVVSALVLVFSFKKDKINIQVGDTSIVASVADTADERGRGLSGTKELKDNEGMLFIFDKPGPWGVWMKDMNYSLDIIWLDENQKVVDIKSDISPKTYPKSFEPRTDARYVLEVPAGFSKRHGVSINSLVSFRSWLW